MEMRLMRRTVLSCDDQGLVGALVFLLIESFGMLGHAYRLKKTSSSSEYHCRGCSSSLDVSATSLLAVLKYLYDYLVSIALTRVTRMAGSHSL
jgi:hypothetical protein